MTSLRTLVGFVAIGLVLAAATVAAQPVPLGFVANEGQYDERVRFVVHGEARTAFFTRDGVTLNVRCSDRGTHAVRLTFVGCETGVRVEGRGQGSGTVSYFRGESSSWVRGAASFREIVYEGLWPGIDLVYTIEGGALKYSFHVAPGSDPEQIEIACEGAYASLGVDGGIEFRGAGQPLLRDDAPYSFTQESGARAPVSSAYRILDRGRRFGFNVGEYDRTKSLVIDPVTLAYCGYVGGELADWIEGAAVDASGAVYVAGATTSTQAFPVTVGPSLVSGGAGDVFVAKVAPDGRTLDYCGFIGSRNNEYATSVAVDSAGCAYIVGQGSGGPGYPYKNGPPYTGPVFAFVTKINAAGTDLVYSGFIGGQNSVSATGIAVDAQGAAYVCGHTDYPNTLPLAVGPSVTPSGNGATECWVAKVQPSGRALDYCGLIGGWEAPTLGLGIAVDRQGRAYVCGATWATETSFPVTVGPDLQFYRDQLPIPLTGDAFVARVNAAGTALEYCGYIGGWGNDQAHAIAVDAQGAAYVTGSLFGTELSVPVKVGPSLRFAGGVRDAFVAKIDPTGRQFDYLGFLGGTSGEEGRAIAVDEAGAAWVTGHTASGVTFPVRDGPTPRGAAGGIFLSKVAPSGASLEASGTIGGHGSTLRGLGLDGTGNCYVAGYTYDDERSFPVSVGPDLTFNDNSRYCPCGDGFVAKFVTTRLNIDGPTRPGDTVSMTLLASDDAGRPYQVASSFGPGPTPIDSRTLGLTVDALVWISTSGLARGTFVDYAGTIGTSRPGGGRAHAKLVLPPIPATIGTRIHSAFVTLDPAAPSGIRSISGTASFTITAP